jgi:hypothetical protein
MRYTQIDIDQCSLRKKAPYDEIYRKNESQITQLIALTGKHTICIN